MASPEHVQMAASFGSVMLVAAGIGLLTGTTIGKSGVIRRKEKPGEFYVTCFAHLVVGAFCWAGPVLTGRAGN